MGFRRLLNSKHRNNNQRKLISRLAVIVLLCVITTLVAWHSLHTTSHSIAASRALDSDSRSLPFYFQGIDSTAMHSPLLQRPLYPYSVIPRGVTSAHELVCALRYDPVATSHYEGFRIVSARLLRNSKDRQVFVSYRLGTDIYWTKKKMTLHKGETLLSDGKHLARTRCGNRISEVPMDPTSPSEPPNNVLNTPLAPRLPDVSPDPLAGTPIWNQNPAPPILLSMGITPSAHGTWPGGYAPPNSPILCCFGSSEPPSGPPTIPAVSAPEPGVFVLMSAGLAGLLLVQKLRRA